MSSAELKITKRPDSTWLLNQSQPDMGDGQFISLAISSKPLANQSIERIEESVLRSAIALLQAALPAQPHEGNLTSG